MNTFLTNETIINIVTDRGTKGLNKSNFSRGLDIVRANTAQSLFFYPGTPPKTRIFIIGGCGWKHLLPLILHIEKRGYFVTNTAFNNYKVELLNSDICVCIPGWSASPSADKALDYAHSINVKMVDKHILFPEALIKKFKSNQKYIAL